MIKYATAMRLGTADTEAILRRFTRSEVQHPTYQALAELGKVRKTIFLCHFLHDEQVRREVQAGLNVIENWNSANGFILLARGELATNKQEDQERPCCPCICCRSLPGLHQHADVAAGVGGPWWGAHG
jgi:TnpA family transposase